MNLMDGHEQMPINSDHRDHIDGFIFNNELRRQGIAITGKSALC